MSSALNVSPRLLCNLCLCFDDNKRTSLVLYSNHLCHDPKTDTIFFTQYRKRILRCIIYNCERGRDGDDKCLLPNYGQFYLLRLVDRKIAPRTTLSLGGLVFWKKKYGFEN